MAFQFEALDYLSQHDAMSGAQLEQVLTRQVLDEQHESYPRCSLVAVGQRMIPRDPPGEHRSLVVRVGVEVGVAEAGCGMER